MDYSDLTRPSLRADALRAALCAPAGPLARLDVVEEVGSTNAELAARAAADPHGHPHLSVLVAEHQVAGRGRLGRTWSAPPRSGLFVSVLLRPAAPRERWSWLPLLAGASLVEALRRTAGVGASLKWPNDVLVEEGPAQRAPGKVAGLLTEVLPDASGVVVGLGLNVGLSEQELPVPSATSLLLAGSASTDRDVLARAVLRALAADVAGWEAAGGDPVASGAAARVRERCSTIGRAVRVEVPAGQALEGSAEGIDDEGRLLVLADGAQDPVAVSAGDVVHVR